MALTVNLVTGCGSSASIKSSKAKILFALHDEGSSYLAQFMEVAAGDTPIVFINNRPEDDYLKENKYVYVASYEQDAGKYQAEYIWNGLGKPSTVNAIILKGLKGHSAVASRTDSIKQYFWDNNVEFSLVFCDFANWKDEEAYNKLEVFKKTNQQIDCVFANSDAMALGAIKWLKENGHDIK